MTNLSTLIGGGGGAVKSVQTGFIDNATVSTGTDEDASYYDVTISTVVAANCVVFFNGGCSTVDDVGSQRTTTSYVMWGRMTSTTNMRLSQPFGISAFKVIGRWYVVEYDV